MNDTPLLIKQLCQIIREQDNYRRIPELEPELKETAVWAVEVADQLDKHYPGVLPPIDLPPREPTREDILEGNP